LTGSRLYIFYWIGKLSVARLFAFRPKPFFTIFGQISYKDTPNNE